MFHAMTSMDPDGFPRWRSDLDTAADRHGLGRW